MASYTADTVESPPTLREVAAYQPIMGGVFEPPLWGQLWPRGDGFGG